MKIYLASSWRNQDQPAAVQKLRAAGHDVYDFRAPNSGGPCGTAGSSRGVGFSWGDVAGEHWQSTPPEKFEKMLRAPVAVEGFESDRDALDWADACVLLLPCGRSAHLEAGYAAGRGKRLFIVLDYTYEPELMYSWAERIFTSVASLSAYLGATP